MTIPYAMKFLGLGEDKRLRWRGTGFCQTPGGLTRIDDMVHWIAAQAVQRRLQLQRAVEKSLNSSAESA